MSDKEFFDLAEARILNGESASEPGGEPLTAWGNLGLWDSAENYPDACRALAMCVGKLAGLEPSSRLFDAGFGCGDQLLLWREEFGLSQLHGINFSRSQTELAKKRLMATGVDTSELRFGSVADASLWPPLGSVDAVIALDCAYHFPSRQDFFKAASQSTHPEGRLVLADIICGDESLSAMDQGVLKTVARASRIPAVNLIGAEEYQRQLATSGWSVRTFHDLTASVFLPFGDWLKVYRQSEWAPSLGPWRWSKYRVTARMLAWAARTRALRFVLVMAEKE